MSLDILQNWIGVLSGGIALVIGLITALWAYTKYVLENAILPPCQFDLECRLAGTQSGKKILELLVHLKNLGSSTLIVQEVRVDVLYLMHDEEPQLLDDAAHRSARLRFPHALRKDLQHENPESNGRGFRVVPHRTFVRPNVDQVYTVITTVPDSASFVLVWASFQYAQNRVHVSQILVTISRLLGLVQYSLDDVKEPHTIERVFQVVGSTE